MPDRNCGSKQISGHPQHCPLQLQNTHLAIWFFFVRLVRHLDEEVGGGGSSMRMAMEPVESDWEWPNSRDGQDSRSRSLIVDYWLCKTNSRFPTSDWHLIPDTDYRLWQTIGSLPISVTLYIYLCELAWSWSVIENFTNYFCPFSDCPRCKRKLCPFVQEKSIGSNPIKK